MLTAIAIAEAIGATAAFSTLAIYYHRARTALRHAQWKADTFESMLDRRERRAGGFVLRDEKGRFA